MPSCPCCSDQLLRHIRSAQIYWFCRSCWQEMPVFNLGECNPIPSVGTPRSEVTEMPCTGHIHARQSFRRLEPVSLSSVRSTSTRNTSARNTSASLLPLENHQAQPWILKLSTVNSQGNHPFPGQAHSFLVHSWYRHACLSCRRCQSFLNIFALGQLLGLITKN